MSDFGPFCLLRWDRFEPSHQSRVQPCTISTLITEACPCYEALIVDSVSTQKYIHILIFTTLQNSEQARDVL